MNLSKMKIINILFISCILLACNSMGKKNELEKNKKIQEDTDVSKNYVNVSDISGTWYELTIVNGDTVIYKYSNLTEEDMIAPNSFKLTDDSLTIIYFSDAPTDYAVDTVLFKNNEYFFPTGNNYSFKWIDKERHIGMWIDYYGSECWNDTLRATLYVDSMYNKFPFAYYKWE